MVTGTRLSDLGSGGGFNPLTDALVTVRNGGGPGNPDVLTDLSDYVPYIGATSDVALGTIGSEIITNGNFAANANNWSLGTGLSYDSTNHAILYTGSASSGNLAQTFGALQPSGWYQFSFDISNKTGSGVLTHTFTVVDNVGTELATMAFTGTNGTKSGILYAASVQSIRYIWIKCQSNGVAATNNIDNVSFKLLTPTYDLLARNGDFTSLFVTGNSYIAGNLGVGIGASEKLDVYGTVLAGASADGSGYKLRGTDGSVIRALDPTNTGATNSINIGAVGSGGHARIHGTNIVFVLPDGTELARFTGDGKLGMGLSNPVYSIEISQYQNVALRLNDTAISGADWLILPQTSNTTKLFRVFDNYRTVDVFQINDSGDPAFPSIVRTSPSGTFGEVFYTDAATAVANNYNVLCLS